MGERDDVVIIGGGVIGLASGLALLEAGRGVRVLEQGEVGRGSSHGNCGTITPSHAPPLAAPGTLVRALRWMLTPDAPLYIAPRVDPALWAWLRRFARRCNAHDWRAAAHGRSAILEASRALMPALLERYRIDCEFEASGVDFLFRTARGMDHVLAEMPLFDELGIRAEAIGGADYVRDDPAVKAGLYGAIRFPGDARLRPDRYVAGLARAFVAAGGVIDTHCTVEAIAEGDGGVRVATSRGDVQARDVLVATGAWSPALARSAGIERLPVQPGKGYSITYDRPAVVPKRPLVLGEPSVCVTVWDSGFRLGSTMEFAGYDTSLNRRRLDALVRGASAFLHQPVGPMVREEWYGWRPMSADDLPYIGRVPGRSHVWLATGHGMLGVSMSAATARLVSDLLCDRTPSIDPAPYAVGRP